MSHQFKIGQQVRRARLPDTRRVDARSGFGEVAEVVRLMPADDTGAVSYRIRSGMAERAVREDEIVAVA